MPRITVRYISSSFCPQFRKATIAEILNNEWNEDLNDLHLYHSDYAGWYYVMIKIWNILGYDPVEPDFNGRLPSCGVYLKTNMLSKEKIPNYDGVMSFGTYGDYENVLIYFGPRPQQLIMLLNLYLHVIGFYIELDRRSLGWGF